MQKVYSNRIEEMFPEDLNHPEGQGNDIAILPIGSVEQHGPHLLLGCDSFISLALAKYTAIASNGILFPLVPYSWIGGLRVWTGTIDIRPGNMGDYLEEVCLGILQMGFKRLLLVNCHGGGREMVFLVASRVFKKTGVPVLAIYPGRIDVLDETKKIWEKHGVRMHGKVCEGSEMLGGLKELGKHELVRKVEQLGREAAKEFEYTSRDFGIQALKEVFEISEVGYDFYHEAQHVFPEATANADAGMEVMKMSANKLAEALEQLKLLQQEMKTRNTKTEKTDARGE